MELTVEQKRQIIRGMQAYITSQDTTGDSKTCSQNKFARDARVNVGYIDAMVKGYETGNFIFNKVVIKDVYFERIAAFIGLELKKGYWQRFETEQYLDIESAFVEAKTGATVKTVIGGTGTGKTFTAEEMKIKYPVGTFVMRCAGDYNALNFIHYMAEILGIKDAENMSKVKVRKAIEKRIKTLYEAGQRPILVLDEAENLKFPAWERVKSIYDNVKELCGFMIMGTPNWYLKMKLQRDKKRDIAPQIFRRFMSGLKTVHLSEVSESDVKEICKEIGINDRYVVNKICDDVDNYGDLHDTILVLQRAAAAQGCKINRQLYENEYGKAC